MTKKETVSINFELDPVVNKQLITDSKKHGRSKKQEARFALNAWYLMPDTEREKWIQKVKMSV
ncbi:hypothetical protein MACH09_47070 [Vibrio sp. MACH09]|uniref:TraY domain-containing protein n=1 Tax=Vibrio sp. MACH09 TaxID=3025122 RepID=UPI0027942ECD|nr:TraY domain-containing protein [Vibrio sp. MACH09]GLO64199.1 hypothetical protein MACH09_47070 [Vibrio sp. MACH09]